MSVRRFALLYFTAFSNATTSLFGGFPAFSRRKDIPKIWADTTNSQSPTPLQLNFTVERSTGNMSAREIWVDASRRGKRGYIIEPLLNMRDTAYVVTIYLGSEQQEIKVILDTGSSDLWVPSIAYDPNISKSAYDTGDPFSIRYMDGADVEGTYFVDSFLFSSQTIMLPFFQFARSDGGKVGILGIADRNQEASFYTYDNLPWALVSAGLIARASYSVFLGPSRASGLVIFGGIDTEKFTGDLVEYEIDPRLNGLAVDIKSVVFNGRIFEINQPALLDCGTTLGLLDGELMNELDGVFNTTVWLENGFEYRSVSCEQPTDKYIEFDFGKNRIVLSYADAVYRSQSGECLLGFAYYQNRQILGDVFLRHAYVYYDLSAQTISLAQASYSEKSNIVGV